MPRKILLLNNNRIFDVTGSPDTIVMQVAREMDYKVEITERAFSGLIPSVHNGKADIAGASMSIT